MVLDGIDTMLDGIINDLMCLKAKPQKHVVTFCVNYGVIFHHLPPIYVISWMTLHLSPFPSGKPFSQAILPPLDTLTALVRIFSSILKIN